MVDGEAGGLFERLDSGGSWRLLWTERVLEELEVFGNLVVKAFGREFV